ncbi:MAG: hypothetical protein U1F68_12180 [Gammaproteobacteria bacterium]
MTQPETPAAINDTTLMDEIDEIFRKKLLDAEQQGASADELKRLAADYGSMFDMLDAKLSGHVTDEPPKAFKERTFEFLVECFSEKLQVIYDANNRHITDVQASDYVNKTRSKLRRIETVLFHF